MESKVFVVRAEYGRLTEIFRKHQYVGIGWIFADPRGKVNLSDKNSLKTYYKELYPEDSAMRLNQNVGQIYRFINDIRIGDLVICPTLTNDLLVGKVESDCYFLEDETSNYYFRRYVKWFSKTINRHKLSVPLQNTLRSSLTCFLISTTDEILEALEIKTQKSSEIEKNQNFVHSNFELIKKRILELDANEFELLVANVLKTLGFEPKQETGKVGDGGIDFEGVLDVRGVAVINLQVQVKRYDKGVIGEKEIRNFRGALKRDYQGCFITLSSFNKKAIESANDTDKEIIRLIDGTQFIEVFIEQYEKIIASMYSDDLDDLADKLKFKRSLLPI